ncbi:unnamed protein product [Urochloa humidicola]
MLQEIELHPEISETARQEWEAAAQSHPNRPIVLPFVTVNDLVGVEPEKDQDSSAEETGHEVVIQGQLADEAPQPSCVQHMPLSTCRSSVVSSEMDAAAHRETIIDDQLLIEEPQEHTNGQTHDNSTIQSRTIGILGSTSDHSGLSGERDDPRKSKRQGEPIALEEPTYENGIQGWPDEKAIKYSLMLADQTGNYVSRGPLSIATAPFSATQTRM